MKLIIDIVAETLKQHEPNLTEYNITSGDYSSGCFYLTSENIVLWNASERLYLARPIADDIIPTFTSKLQTSFDSLIPCPNYEQLPKVGIINNTPFYKLSPPQKIELPCYEIWVKDIQKPQPPRPHFDRNTHSEAGAYIFGIIGLFIVCVLCVVWINSDWWLKIIPIAVLCLSIVGFVSLIIEFVNDIKSSSDIEERNRENADRYNIDYADYQHKLAKFDIDSKTMYDEACQNKLDKYERECNVYNIIAEKFNRKQVEYSQHAHSIKLQYEFGDQQGIADYFKLILSATLLHYPFVFGGETDIAYYPESKLLIVEYHLPSIDEIPNLKEIKYLKTYDEYRRILLSEKELEKLYDEIIYKITIRSIAEIFHFDTTNAVDVVNFNGRVIANNKAIGKLENSCILSVQVGRTQFESIDLNYIDAKACFKHFKGVGSSKLCDMTAIVPIMEINRQDKRFVDAHSVVVDNGTNLAAMGWEDFEHLIRELFDKEFNQNGGEVKITQSSRDGGVDAIAFDPDPIRGGKIVIQAKRYTNTVGVSAVRDLYGTVINEGANKGILITTSEYGSDSYNFAKDKPITLLNGGHLLYLLEKHGQKARIDLAEAKEVNSKRE